MKPGRGVMAFVNELTQLAKEADDNSESRLVSLLFRALPREAKLAMGGIPLSTAKMADVAAKADGLMSILLTFPDEGSSTSPAALAVGGQTRQQ
jgi:hypothetical protein